MKNKNTRRDFIRNAAIGSSAFLLPGKIEGTNLGNKEKNISKKLIIPGEGAYIKSVNGMPELFIDGKKSSRMWGRLALPADYGPEKLEQYMGAGIDVYMTAIDATISLCWDGEDEYYFDKYEAHIRRLVDKKPDIRLILYAGGRGGSPYKWCKKNYDELTLFSTGKRVECASLASEIWSKDSNRAFSEFVKYFSTGKYANNVIGFNPVYNANEWFSHHRLTNDELGWPDFSKPMVRHFRKWLKEKYGSDVKLLRESWNDRNVSFENAAIPTVEQRLYTENPFVFLNCTPMGNRISDYYQCYDELVADLGISYCKTIKEASNGKKLAGMMHGYSYCGRYGVTPHHHGHGFAMRVITSPYVDFLHSPYHYHNRNANGVHYSQHAIDTVISHGKLMIDQIDTKTHLRLDVLQNASNLWESKQILKRDVIYSISKNCSCYWLEGGPGTMFPTVRYDPEVYWDLWFDHPELKALIGDLKKLTDQNQSENTQSVAEVAIFTSNAGTYFQKLSRVYGNLFVEIFRQWIMPHTGVQFDDYIMEDIPNIRKKYKVCIFMDAHYMSASLRKNIKSWLDENQSTAIWFYAPGYLDENGCNIKNSAEVTGINLEVSEETAHLQTKITSKKHAYTKNIATEEFGSDVDPQEFRKDTKWMPWPFENEDFKMNPVFFANDSNVEVLGKLKTNNKPSLVVKDLEGRRSIYSSAPMLPPEILRNIFSQSGVHLFNKSGEAVYANSKYIGISAISGEDGNKEILLTEKCDVYNALTDEVLARSTRKVTLNMKFKETLLLKTVPV